MSVTLRSEFDSVTDDKDRETWRTWISKTLGLASYRLHISQALLALCLLPVAAVMVFAGLISFTWAANPPPYDNPSLRNADLVGANLDGANLDGMDLSGVDLTRASLRGASLDGATLDGVVWASTTCPDGTSSEQAARQRQGGESSRPQSCEGHLTP